MLKKLLERGRILSKADRLRLGALGVCLVIALLLWARLIVVSNMPRMAIAGDEAAQSTSGKTAAPAAADRDANAPAGAHSPADRREAGEKGDNSDFDGDREKSRAQVTEDRE